MRLARQVAYGKQGTLMAQDLEGQRNTSSCLTLIGTGAQRHHSLHHLLASQGDRPGEPGG
jgi:hypothetical protein